MASRREFLQIGVAALALPISARNSVSPVVPEHDAEPAPTPLYKAVFDERFTASRLFGETVQRLGVPVHAIRGDITDLWFHDLYARWKQGPAAIAGLTGHGPIFCLDRLAWDQGMRVVFRAEHTRRSDGTIEHALSGPAVMLRQAADLGGSDTEWAVRMAELVTRCPVNRSPVSKAAILTPSAASASSEQETLISWVIAPVKRA
ncbi:MAG TPA: hypothetical protein VJO53_03755 [Candidatus Acidoferrales bacterium]|nr:hypothetical protein [Candidatus Acidoferrales bacterium]